MDRTYSNPEAESWLREVALAKGFNAWLGIRLVAAGGGKLELEMPVRPDMLQHHGYVHGGVIGTLADDACAWAAAAVAGDVVTASYTLQLLAPAQAPLMRAKAAVLKAGKRNVSVEAKIFAEPQDGDPVLVAVALASIAVLSR